MSMGNLAIDQLFLIFGLLVFALVNSDAPDLIPLTYEEYD